MNIQAVTYVVQRMASLGVLFTLLALACYLTARHGVAPKRRNYYAGAIIFWALRLGIKENAVLLLSVIARYAICFFRAEWRQCIKEMWGRERGRWQKIRVWIGIALIILLMVWAAITVSGVFSFSTTFSKCNFNGFEQILTQSWDQFFYLSPLFWP